MMLGIGLCISSTSTAPAESQVCDNPAQVLDADSDVYLMHLLFNATSSSRRLFSEVHYYEPEDPHLTIGMGHWVGGNIADLFHKMQNNNEVWVRITEKWAGQLSGSHWEQFRKETGETGGDANSISDGLGKVLCASNPTKACVVDNLVPWTKNVGERFNSTGHWFTKGWKAISRDKSVARIQAEHWSSSVLETGAEDARKRGITKRGGIASVISARSSGLGATMFPVGTTVAKAKKGSLSRRWSLTEVPDAARPTQSNVDEEQLLKDWISVAAWQYYTLKKGRVRSRMRAIWDVFYSQSWGPLTNPSSLSKSTVPVPHNGCVMVSEPFDFTVTLSQDPTDCTKPIKKIVIQSPC